MPGQETHLYTFLRPFKVLFQVALQELGRCHNIPRIIHSQVPPRQRLVVLINGRCWVVIRHSASRTARLRAAILSQVTERTWTNANTPTVIKGSDALLPNRLTGLVAYVQKVSA